MKAQQLDHQPMIECRFSSASTPRIAPWDSYFCPSELSKLINALCQIGDGAWQIPGDGMRNNFPALTLPRPIVSAWEWQLGARCRDFPVSHFFPPTGARGGYLRQIEDTAKKVCALCPVRRECLRHALVSDEPYGIWGGLTAAELVDPKSEVTPRRRVIGMPVRPFIRRRTMTT